MKNLTLIVIPLILAAGCGTGKSIPAEPTPAASSETRAASPLVTPDPWLPQAVETCINSVRDEYELAPSMSFNPFYLRADFDSDGNIDHAVLVHSQASDSAKRNGVLICSEDKETALFGAAFNPTPPFTSFDGDNFVTGSWEIVSKSALLEHARDAGGKSRLEGATRGDVVAFFHEGGAVYIYWDGLRFKVIEGS